MNICHIKQSKSACFIWCTEHDEMILFVTNMGTLLKFLFLWIEWVRAIIYNRFVFSHGRWVFLYITLKQKMSWDLFSANKVEHQWNRKQNWMMCSQIETLMSEITRKSHRCLAHSRSHLRTFAQVFRYTQFNICICTLFFLNIYPFWFFKRYQTMWNNNEYIWDTQWSHFTP